MKITADGPNAKVIAKAILALAKFGNDLFFEADEHCVQLRSLNSTKSAMGTMKFNRTFFDVFEVGAGEENFCHIGMKASVGIFRNMKQVEHCEISIIPAEAKFVLKLKCRMETMKDIVLSILDDENLTTTVSTNDMTNRIVGTHQIFNEISNNFNTGEEEITLEVEKDCVVAKNYVEGSRVNDKFMRSQLKLSSREFESFRVTQEANITFCLRELRAFLMFAEAVRGTIDLNFEQAGSPICVKIKKFNEIECTLLMATVAPEDISLYENGAHNNEDTTIQTHRSKPTTSAAAQKRKHSNDRTAAAAAPAKTRRSHADDTTLSDASTLFEFNRVSEHSTQMGSTSDTVDVLRAANTEISAQITQVPPALPQNSEVSVTFGITEDTEEIPLSPRNRAGGINVRSIFSRCFESTYVPREPSPTSQVYVPDSDTED